MAILALSAACGGDDSTSTTPSPSTARTATSAATATTAASTGATPTAKELSEDLGTLRTVMQNTISNAKAGDVQGTRDAEGGADKAMEAIIRAVRLKDAALADKLEALELDYEHQADSSNPDLAVIARDAQKVIDLLSQVVTTLNITEGTPCFPSATFGICVSSC